MIPRLLPVLLLAAACCPLAGCGASKKPGAGLEAFTGAHSRVVWMRQVKTDAGFDPFGYGANFALMGLDTRDGRGPRVLLPGPLSCRKPLLSADGKTVVFTDLPARTMRAVSFDGGPVRELGRGMAVELWRDPAGVEWLYFAPDFKENSTRDAVSLSRLRLDRPGEAEAVWDSTPVTPDNFQISADGRMAAGLFPWSAGGTLNLEQKLYRRMGTGCWASMSPDNSYRSWLFDGAHENLLVRGHQAATPATVRINRHPELEKRPVYHPRWSNHASYFVFTGPYQGGQNGIDKGGVGIDLYAGRFNADATALEAVFEINRDDPADFFPDLWVAGGETAGQREAPAARSVSAGPASATLADLEKNLRLRWLNQKENDLRDAAGRTRIFNFTARGGAVPGRFHDMVIRGGAFDSGFETADLLQAIRASGQFTLELTLTPSQEAVDPVGAPFVWGDDFDRVNVAISQYRGQWYLRLRTDERPVASRLDIQIAPAPEDDAPHHLLVAYQSGRLAVWLDGALTCEFADITGALSSWEPHPLRCGALPADRAYKKPGDQMRWAGRLEGLRLLDKAVLGAEAEALWNDARARWKDRVPAARHRVLAELVQAGLTSSVESIKPYRRLLFDSVYRVREVREGTLKPGDEILVARWGILDALPVPGLPKPGAAVELLLESRDDHPELEGERIDTLDRFELPAFVTPFE